MLFSFPGLDFQTGFGPADPRLTPPLLTVHSSTGLAGAH